MEEVESGLEGESGRSLFQVNEEGGVIECN